MAERYVLMTGARGGRGASESPASTLTTVRESDWAGKVSIAPRGNMRQGPGIRMVCVPGSHATNGYRTVRSPAPVASTIPGPEAIALAVRAEHGFGHSAAIYSQRVETITKMAREINVSIFVANGPTLAGLGEGGEGYTSFSIASPTGEGLTRPRTFSRLRRLTVKDGLRIV